MRDITPRKGTAWAAFNKVVSGLTYGYGIRATELYLRMCEVHGSKLSVDLPYEAQIKMIRSMISRQKTEFGVIDLDLVSFDGEPPRYQKQTLSLSDKARHLNGYGLSEVWLSDKSVADPQLLRSIGDNYHFLMSSLSTLCYQVERVACQQGLPHSEIIEASTHVKDGLDSIIGLLKRIFNIDISVGPYSKEETESITKILNGLVELAGKVSV